MDEPVAALPHPAAVPSARVRFGLRARLLGAFFTVAALTAGASAAAYLSYGGVERALHVIADESLPATATSLQMSRDAADLAAAGPRIVRAATTKDAAAALAGVQVPSARLRAGITGLRGAPGTTLRKISDALTGNLRRLVDATNQRIRLGAKRAGLVGAIGDAHRELLKRLAPLVDDASFDLQDALQSAAGGKDADAVRKRLGVIADRDLPGFQGMLDLRSEANLLLGVLSETSNLPSAEQIPPLRDSFTASAERLRTALKAIPKAATLAAPVQALIAAGTGPGGIFEVRRAELAQAEAAQGAAVQNAELATLLNRQVGEIAGASRSQAVASVAATRAAIARGKVQLGAFAAASLLLSLLIAWLYVGRNLVRRLAGLRDGMVAIAAGNLNAAVRTGGGDEIAEMADALLVFRDTATAAHEAESRVQREREAMAERRRGELFTLADGFETSVQDLVRRLSGAASHMRANAEEMADTASRTRTEAAAIGGAAGQASANVGSVAAAMEELGRSVDEISRQVMQSTVVVREATATAEATDQIAGVLGQSVKTIGETVTLIGGIAGKTNLLALNATIEAARAGEAGRGFAVVASEVRTLATQTARATQEIGGRIAAIGQQTERVLEAIRSIGATIADVDSIAAVIAAAVEQQSATTAEIVRNIQQAAAVTVEVSDRTGGISTAAEQTGKAAHEVLGSATSLAAQSEVLAGEVSGFLATIRAG